MESIITCLHSSCLHTHYFLSTLLLHIEFYQLFLTLKRKHSICLGSQSQKGLITHAIKPQNVSVSFIQILFFILRKCPLIPFVLNISIPNECFIIPKCSSCVYWDDNVFFVAVVWYIVNWYSNVYSIFHLWVKYHWLIFWKRMEMCNSYSLSVW